MGTVVRGLRGFGVVRQAESELAPLRRGTSCRRTDEPSPSATLFAGSSSGGSASPADAVAHAANVVLPVIKMTEKFDRWAAKGTAGGKGEVERLVMEFRGSGLGFRSSAGLPVASAAQHDQP